MVQTILVNTALMAFACLMAWAAWSDVRRYTIPNWISGALIALWLVAAPFALTSWGQAGVSLLTFAVVLGIGMALWAPGWLGGGDVKLIAAGALWFGWPDTGSFLLAAMVCGGVLALVLMVLRRFSPALPLNAELIAKTPLAQGAPAPYGVAICAGALVVLPQSAIFAAYLP
ncbi:MAG: A24 family peptidase [Oceanicaulis sp.]